MKVSGRPLPRWHDLPFLTTQTLGWGGGGGGGSHSGSDSHSSVLRRRTVSRDSGRWRSALGLPPFAVSLVGVLSESWLQPSSPRSRRMSRRSVSTAKKDEERLSQASLTGWPSAAASPHRPSEPPPPHTTSGPRLRSELLIGPWACSI